VAIYGDSDNQLYAAIWQDNTQKYRWKYRERDTTSDFQTWFDNVTQIMRPACISISDDQRYVSVFRDDSIGGHQAVHGMGSNDYQDAFDKYKKKYVPICMDGGGSGSDARYAGIFATKDQPQERKWTATGTAVSTYSDLDDRMKKVMKSKGVRAASLTLSKNGSTVFSRGYTWAEPDYAITQPDTLFRLASVSKMFTAGAIYELKKAGLVSGSDKPFRMLNLSAPSGMTANSDVYGITIKDLLDHKGGWDSDKSGFDPVFASRDIGKAMGLSTYPSKKQMAEYMVAQKLQHTPGSTYAYSNFGYVMLGLVIEHLSGKDYEEYVKNICSAIGVNHVHLAKTTMESRRSNEALAEAPDLSQTALDPNSDKWLPTAYGGFVLQTMDSGGGLLANTEAMASFAHHYAAWTTWGNWLRSAGSARTGSENGTRTRVGSRSNGYDYAFAFNTRYNLEDVVDASGTEYIDQFGNDLETLIDTLP
jgi:CubicO group peptidase (beta-lactamase class C family)